MIEYKSGRACFRIRQESEGIFTAFLVSSDGEQGADLPKEITLVRSVRNWTGSVDDEILLRELGTFIDASWPLREVV
ncbi:MAG TPA: hypothetical protein VFT06_14285 [Flavisolibacter sp.]|nr:hypothetical protein [Flavisolibacter sp.]